MPDKLKFEIGELVVYHGKPTLVAGYIEVGPVVCYDITPPGEENSRAWGEFEIQGRWYAPDYYLKPAIPHPPTENGEA